MPGKLVQTTVDQKTLRKLDALARAHGHRRASYLRHLIELHVRALSPELATATNQMRNARVSKLDAIRPLRGKKS